MNVEGWVIQVEAWAREELAGQKTMAKLLDRQEAAVSANRTDELVAVSQEIETHLQNGRPRDRRRRDLLGKLARAFDVSPDTLSLRSIADRAEALGIDVASLRETRLALREETAGVLRQGRRIASIARYHQAFLNEVLQILAPREGESDQPVLLDARG